VEKNKHNIFRKRSATRQTMMEKQPLTTVNSCTRICEGHTLSWGYLL